MQKGTRLAVLALAAVMAPATAHCASRAQSERLTEYADSQLQAAPEGTKAGPVLNIKVVGGASHTVNLGSVISSVQSLHRHGSRLVVLGKIGPGGASEVRIVDWASGQVLDSFWAYDPAVSPNSVLIAFVRFYPVHFVDGTESQYRLYRVEASPEQNRSFYKGQLQQGRSSYADVGQPLYPAPGKSGPRKNIGITDEQAHEHLSLPVWSADSRQLALLDAHRGKVRVVLVPAPDGEARQGLGIGVAPRAMPSAPLDGLGKLCLRGASPEDCTVVPQEAITLAFDPAGRTLKVQMSERTLFPSGYAKVIPLAAFKAGP